MDPQIRKEILKLMDQHRIMTIATLRPDGWPQATTVGYVHDGLTLYFLCGLDSQKARNIARDNRVSITIDRDTSNVMAITGLSMAGHAIRVDDREKAAEIMGRLIKQYEGSIPPPGPMPGPDEVCICRVEPTIISVLDYSKGFGHTDLVTC